MKILLIRLDHLGDLVLTTPLIRALAQAGHSVEVVTLRWLRVVLEGNPHISEAFALEDIAPAFPADWRLLRNWMKARAYDCILLPNSKPRELLWCSWGSGVRSRLALQGGILGRLSGHQCIRIGQSFMQGRHYSDIQLDLARALDIPCDGLKLDYFCRDDEINQAKKKIVEMFPGFDGEPIIGIHPGCQGNTCNLPSSVYGQLASLILARTNCRIIVTGSAKEKGLLDSWPKETVSSPRVYTSMGVFDLRSLAAIISQMSNYVIGSTGPLHLASALGIRTTSPFCSLPPITSSVWGNITGTGACIQPNPAGCHKWIAQAKPHQHCDFRGEIKVETLWNCLREEKSVQL
ncbi:glycosyltransferase family 9 protein [Methylacidiphilales bacterium]|nr:glycosyltransferase family 9 protein [Candidatus Methylacidiphilales bacterium]